MTEPVSYTGNYKLQFAVVAKRIGSANDLRAMTMNFGLSDSFEGALAKVEMKLRGNLDFRKKYSGWVFYPVLVSHNVKVSEVGVVSVAKGDRKVVMVK